MLIEAQFAARFHSVRVLQLQCLLEFGVRAPPNPAYQPADQGSNDGQSQNNDENDEKNREEIPTQDHITGGGRHQPIGQDNDAQNNRDPLNPGESRKCRHSLKLPL
jgi:hypothetical protein